MPAAFEVPLSRGLATQTQTLLAKPPGQIEFGPANAHRPGAQEATAPVAQPPRLTDNSTTAAALFSILSTTGWYKEVRLRRAATGGLARARCTCLSFCIPPLGSQHQGDVFVDASHLIAPLWC
jgi:hypothetical protein